MATHFIAIRGKRLDYAAKIFGPPDFIHYGWDMRARREIADGDVLIFGEGTANDPPRRYSYDDERRF